jgi:hypothetical protein
MDFMHFLLVGLSDFAVSRSTKLIVKETSNFLGGRKRAGANSRQKNPRYAYGQGHFPMVRACSQIDHFASGCADARFPTSTRNIQEKWKPYLMTAPRKTITATSFHNHIFTDGAS